MSSWAVLHQLRIGCVQYLNSQPLIYGYDGAVVYDHPSELARGLARGALDAALVPIFAALNGQPYQIVDDVAIGSDGPVFSVFVACRGELRDVRTIAVDPASLTAVHLMEALLRERGCDFQIVHVEELEVAATSGAVHAVMLIGNQAIDFRRRHEGAFNFIDLGEEWQRQMQFPFVFAVWLLRPDLPASEEVARAFRALQRHGLAHLEDVIAGESFQDLAFRERYLTKHIRFGLGAREKIGIEKFRALLVNYGFVAPSAAPLRYV